MTGAEDASTAASCLCVGSWKTLRKGVPRPVSDLCSCTGTLQLGKPQNNHMKKGQLFVLEQLQVKKNLSFNKISYILLLLLMVAGTVLSSLGTLARLILPTTS